MLNLINVAPGVCLLCSGRARHSANVVSCHVMTPTITVQFLPYTCVNKKDDVHCKKKYIFGFGCAMSTPVRFTPPRFLDLDVPYVFVSAGTIQLSEEDVDDLLSSDLIAFDCEGAHLVQLCTRAKAYLFYVADPGVRRAYGDLLRKVMIEPIADNVLLGFACTRDFEVLTDMYPDEPAFAFHCSDGRGDRSHCPRRTVVDLQCAIW